MSPLPETTTAMNRRVLLIDDNEAIHRDFRKILTPPAMASADLLAAEAALFGAPTSGGERVQFELVTASQGEAGYELAKQAAAAGRPFAMAFVDVRMPPGWNGLETIERIWAELPDVEMVICTAFSDFSWEETLRRLGRTDRLLIVKKPFDQVEVLQIASALTHKWNLEQQARRTLSDLSSLVSERTHDLELARDSLLAMNHDLVAARDAAEAANRSKTMFLANISHELRTPMTAIIGYADELQEHMSARGAALPEREALETIRRNANHLVAIINDLLEISKMDTGKLVVERGPCDALSILNEVILLLQPKAAAKQVTLACEYASAVPGRIVTDPLRLRQILLNLLDNAIKFTQRGEVHVGVRLQAADEPRLVIAVRDSGVGISDETIERLFQPFAQADSSTSRRFGGTGLGLAISRQLAHLLGGAIDVHSEPDVGSTFTLSLPTGDLDGVPMLGSPSDLPPAGAASARPDPVPGVAGARILVAEDGRDNQLLLLHMLRRVGCEVELVADGAACVQRMQQAPAAFDLVLMDIQMPVLDGIAATRQLRERGHRVPIVALTANALPQNQEVCADAGCDGFLTKPIDRRRLFETIGRLVGDRAAPRA
ncbi:MAG TPA: response regulator [Planctomycetota bacterium]|nr:response regulator [Planctomycetota bacterium]